MPANPSFSSKGNIKRQGKVNEPAKTRGQAVHLRTKGACIKVILLLLTSFSLWGCQGGLGWSVGEPRSEDRGAKLSVFLNLKEASGPGVWWRLASLEVLSGDVWSPLLSEPLDIDASRIGPGQIFLCRLSIPPGLYEGLRFTLEKAALQREGRKVFLALESPVTEVPFSSPVRLVQGDSQSLFITWDVEASLKGTAILAPALTVAPQSVPLIADLAYVACPEIETVYIVRTDRNWVSGSLGMSGRPTYLGVDRDRNRLYVLASEESVIKVVELSNNRLVDLIRIPMTQEPSFMTLSPDGLSAYILEERGNYIIRMDLLTGTMRERVRLGERPSYALYLDRPDNDRLAVSSGLSQAVFLLDVNSLLPIEESVSVASSPRGLLFLNDRLYIAESTSNTVSVYDLATRQVRERLHVGFSPTRLLLSGNQIYVANSRGGSVSIILPGQLSVLKNIPVGSGPLEMASSQSRKWLYVGVQGSEGLTVIDLTSNRVIGHIALGAVPLGIAVIQ